ncbi:LysM peptidoglycan-binding domain-containing protein, partial [Candidatus Parcubacteria bacterium]|nr:LysM peptidoglycan-binding domain-containing protein [Candidatus Parcubacteria bacterium]
MKRLWMLAPILFVTGCGRFDAPDEKLQTLQAHQDVTKNSVEELKAKVDELTQQVQGLTVQLKEVRTLQKFQYTVKRGDTLWHIAKSFYANPFNYERIAQANKIESPKFLIHPRQVLEIPLGPIEPAAPTHTARNETEPKKENAEAEPTKELEKEKTPEKPAESKPKDKIETPTEKPTEKEPPQPYFEQIPSEPEPAKPPIKKSQQRSNKPELLER